MWNKVSLISENVRKQSCNDKIRSSFYRCKIWIRFLWVQASVILNILEGIIHEATIATLIALRARAVHQVLLAQQNKFPSFPEHLSFKSTGGTKCPTRTTLTLKIKRAISLQDIYKDQQQSIYLNTLKKIWIWIQLYLILHRSYIAFLSPIHRFGDIDKERFTEHFPLLMLLILKTIHHLPKFFIGL